MTAPHRDDLSARLQRVEEAQGFSERTIEQLSAEIAVLNRRLAEAHAQIQRLEARISRLLEPAPDEDSAPES